MSDTESQPIDLERTFRLMDVADELRRQRRRVEEHLETSDRDSIKAHLIERYRAMGHDADPQLIDEAIDRVLAQAYRFRPPEPGLGLRLGRLWARRRQIGRRLTLPLVALLALGGLGATIVNSLNSLWYGRQERTVEALVGDLALEAQRARSRFSELEQALPATDLDPRAVAELRGRLASSGAALATVETFLEEYAPDGNPREGVTPSNHDDVASRLPEVRAALGDAGDALSAGAAILDLVDLRARAASLAAAAETTAVGPAARTRAQELAARVGRQADAGDDTALRATVGELETLLAILEQEYTLRVVALTGYTPYSNTKHTTIQHERGPAHGSSARWPGREHVQCQDKPPTPHASCAAQAMSAAVSSLAPLGQFRTPLVVPATHASLALHWRGPTG